MTGSTYRTERSIGSSFTASSTAFSSSGADMMQSPCMFVGVGTLPLVVPVKRACCSGASVSNMQETQYRFRLLEPVSPEHLATFPLSLVPSFLEHLADIRRRQDPFSFDMWPTITSYKPLEPPPLTRCDLILASMAFGFTARIACFY